MLKAAIFSIGEELLEGSVVDSNSAFIAKTVLKEGIIVKHIQMLPDDINIIADTIKEYTRKFDVIFTTGGLGPTFDDLTAEAVAKVCDVKTKLNEEAYKKIETMLAVRNVKLNDGHKHQAELPENCILIPNDHGTALGFAMKAGKCHTVSMPGVPFEMYPMLQEYVIPMLKKIYDIKAPYMEDMHFGRVPESVVDDAVTKTGIPATTKCIINASKGEVIVRVRDENAEIGKKFADSVKEKLAEFYFGSGDKDIAEVLTDLLAVKGMTLSVAESCTGGMLGEEITAVAGVSKVFYGGVISYDNSVKMKQLKVSESILSEFGAVSEECAVAMAKGVQALIGTNCAISITGIAGPDGGTDDKPVGTVFIAVVVNDKVVCKKHFFRGKRTAIRQLASKTAMQNLYEVLRG